MRCYGGRHGDGDDYCDDYCDDYDDDKGDGDGDDYNADYSNVCNDDEDDGRQMVAMLGRLSAHSHPT